ncbi:hypothetical protein P261_01774 [Lachnospiraceae bacterium TWA4]|nr:hypothetical protein P261_01774 [Lachnospiraceae bacterium TWA4]
MKKVKMLLVYVVLLIGIVAVALLAYRLSMTPKELVTEPNFKLVPGAEDEEQVENMENYETLVVTPTAVSEIEKLPEKEKESTDYSHYLLLGVDTRDSIKTSKSDAVMLLSINELKGRVLITTIPRDLYVYIKGKGWDKLAYAYSYGKSELVKQTIENNLDISIKGYFTIDFEGLEHIVDELGGLTLFLTEKESNHIRDFFKVEGTEAGQNQLNGKQVVAYSRIRLIDSDFQRMNREYTILSAFYDKLNKYSKTTYPKLISELYDYLKTDCTLAKCIDIISVIEEEGLEQMDTYPLVKSKDGYGRIIDGVYYFVLDDMKECISQWHAYLGDNYKPSTYFQMISDSLANIILESKGIAP